MHVVIFEASRWPTMAPLVLNRPAFTLLSGMGTLLDKQVHALQPTRLTLWVRPGLEDYCRRHIIPGLKVPTTVNTPLDKEPALLMNGRTLHLAPYEYPPHEAAVIDENSTLASALVQRPGLAVQDALQRTPAWMHLMDLPQMMSQGRTPDYPWDLIKWNEEALVHDSIHLHDRRHPMPSGPYHVVQPENIWLADDVKLHPGCVLDASSGPVVIEAGAGIGANSIILGPCWIGPGSQVLPLSLISPGTSIGPMCKVAGEISNSIILGYSNKAHYGFLGDSYLGQWVNLGAGTTTSNLKNTYGQISVQMGAQTIPTGRRFLGSIIGDHTKTAIGTRLMTGTYVGYSCMLAATAPPPRFVPSFTFLTDSGSQKYDMTKAAAVAAAVYARRSLPWTPADEQMMHFAADQAALVEKTPPKPASP